MNTRPPPTAGDDSPIPSGEALYFHFKLPSARLTACRSPFCDPTYATPSAIVADDSIGSPASYVQSSLSEGGSVASVVPSNAGDPRNCGQAVAGACAEMLTAATIEARKNAITSNRMHLPRPR